MRHPQQVIQTFLSANNMLGTQYDFKLLQLYKEVTPNIDLQQICQELSAVRHYEGILDLCLTTAHKRDPQNIALYYYKNGEPSDDTGGYNMFTARFVTQASKEMVDLQKQTPLSNCCDIKFQ